MIGKIDSAEEFLDIVGRSSEILIISHINPDGDAVGSVVAMRSYIELMRGNRAGVVLPGEYPQYLSFLDNDSIIMVYDGDDSRAKDFLREADLIIALDINRLDRIGEMQSIVADSQAVKILIDHHPQPVKEDFDLIISDEKVSSTCELLFRLFCRCEELLSGNSGAPHFPLNLAKALYVGMMTDTNNFSNSVSKDTFRMASELLGMGIDKEELQRLVFGGFSEERMRLMGHILLYKMVLLPEYKAGYIVLTIEEQRMSRYEEGDSEGFVNLPLGIRGIEISALFTERKDMVKVSFRSSNDFSVNRFAREFFNGGGHERASGGKLFMKIEDVPAYFEEKLKESLKSEDL
jgi:Exopolyphosphatase-related proteins